MRHLRFAALSVMMLAFATPAGAQEHNRFALGPSFSERAVSNALARGSRGVGIKWRLGHDKSGWGWQYGFGWFAADVDDRTSPKISLGELRVRPLMGGYGYTWVKGPLAVTADVVGGFAFTKVTTTAEGAEVLRRLSAGSDNMSSSGTPVIKPELNCWIDVGRRFGISVDAGYIVARPRVTVGSDTRRFRADTFSLTTGLVYRIF